MKKFLAMLLCVALVAALGINVFAAGVTELEDTYVTEVDKSTVVATAELDFDPDAIKAATAADIDSVAAQLKNANADLSAAKANLKLAQKTMDEAKAAVLAAVKNEMTALQNAYKAIVTEELAQAYDQAAINYTIEYGKALNNIAEALNDAVQGITVASEYEKIGEYTIDLTGLAK